MERKFVIIGIVFILLGIILGAFGAHSLKNVLHEMPEKISSFETGVRYQIYSGFAFLIIGFNTDKIHFSVKPVFWLWLLGTIFFSVSIYFLAIQSVLGISLKFLGPITPLGGLLLIIGWTILLLKFVTATHTQSNPQNQTPNT